jgi:hypothetical protein
MIPRLKHPYIFYCILFDWLYVGRVFYGIVKIHELAVTPGFHQGEFIGPLFNTIWGFSMHDFYTSRRRFTIKKKRDPASAMAHTMTKNHKRPCESCPGTGTFIPQRPVQTSRQRFRMPPHRP